MPWRTIILLLVALLCAAGAAAIIYQWVERQAPEDVPPAVEGLDGPNGGADAGAMAPTGSWPVFRGDPQQCGVAHTALPHELALRWTFETGRTIRSTAAIVAGRVFVGSGDGRIYAIDLQNGDELWRYDAGASVEAPVLVVDGRVVVGDEDGVLHVLDAASGEQRWQHQTDDKILGGAVAWQDPDTGQTRIVVGSYDMHLYCFALSGELVWRYQTGNYLNATPSIRGSDAVVGGCDGNVHVVSLADGEAIVHEIGAYIANAAALVDDRAYFGHYGGRLLGIDLTSGKTRWSYGETKSPFFAAPAVHDGRVVVGGRDLRVHCVSADDGTPIWTLLTGGSVDSSPVIAGDQVVVGSDDGTLYVLSLEDGRERWSYLIGEPVASSPAVAAGMIVIGADDGRVYAFGEPR